MGLLQTIRPAVFRGLSLLGAQTLLVRSLQRQQRLVVLNLHRVSPHPNFFWEPLRPESFDLLCTFAKRHFEVTTFRDLPEQPVGKRPYLVLSFDDGYRDFLEYAVPIMERHGIRANQNVITSCLQSGQPVWNVRLMDLFNRASRQQLAAMPSLPGLAPGEAPDSPQQRIQFGMRYSGALKRLAIAEREARVQTLFDHLGGDVGPFTAMLSAQDVSQLHQAGYEIGSHSHAHENSSLMTDAVFTADVTTAGTVLREILGTAMRVFAFPNGFHRPEQLAILRGLGYQWPLLVGEHHNPWPTRGDSLSRLTFSTNSPPEIPFQAAGWKTWLPRR